LSDSSKNTDPATRDSFLFVTGVVSLFAGWKTYFYAIIDIAGTVGLQGITLSLPVIVNDLEQRTPIPAQVLSVYPYMSASFF
jgi:uncharacterized membrane-anchored protein